MFVHLPVWKSSFLSTNPFLHLNVHISESPVSMDFQRVQQVLLHLTSFKDVWWPSKSVKHDNIQQRPCKDIMSTLKIQILEKYLLVLEISWEKVLIHFKSWLLYMKREAIIYKILFSELSMYICMLKTYIWDSENNI